MIKKFVLNHIYADLKRAEMAASQLAKDSKISYYIVRPPRLVDTPLSLDYEYGVGEQVPKGNGVVSREDVAHFMLKCLFNNGEIPKDNTYIVNSSRYTHVKMELMKILRTTLPPHKFLILRGVMLGGACLIGTGLYRILSKIPFTSIYNHLIKLLTKFFQ